MVAEQDRGQYVLCTDQFSIPRYLALAEGLVVVNYKYRGYGAYDLNVCAQSMGKVDWTLDPICEALIKKGWSQSLVRFHFLEYEPLWNVITDWALKLTKSKWDGSREKYLITQVPTSTRSVYGPDWVIQVHLEDNGHFRVRVGVPEIYEDSAQLGRLLKAIKSLPDADEIRGAHPTMLATG